MTDKQKAELKKKIAALEKVNERSDEQENELKESKTALAETENVDSEEDETEKESVSISVRDIPADVWDRVGELAKRERRSRNATIVNLLNHGTTDASGGQNAPLPGSKEALRAELTQMAEVCKSIDPKDPLYKELQAGITERARKLFGTPNPKGKETPQDDTKLKEQFKRYRKAVDSKPPFTRLKHSEFKTFELFQKAKPEERAKALAEMKVGEEAETVEEPKKGLFGSRR